MRKVELSEIKNTAPGDTTTSKELLNIILSRGAGTNGYAFDEMLVLMPIIEKLDNADGLLLLEEAEFSELVKRINGFKYGMVDAGVFNFLMAVRATEKFELEEVPADASENKKGK